MDSKHQYKVIASFDISIFGMSVIISDVEHGFKKGMVLKSISKGLYWEVEERIIHFDTDKRFECETETFVHVNIRDVSSIERAKESSKNQFEYKVKPIGHEEKPEIGDFLVFSVTIAFPKKLKILEIFDDYFLLQTEKGTGLLNKRYVFRRDTAKIGDYVRHCEHRFHDLVDENDNFIYRY